MAVLSSNCQESSVSCRLWGRNGELLVKKSLTILKITVKTVIQSSKKKQENLHTATISAPGTGILWSALDVNWTMSGGVTAEK